MYDADTGNYVLSIVNGTSMTMTEDSNGDLIELRCQLKYG